jgi:precorrin-6B methylase 2
MMRSTGFSRCLGLALALVASLGAQAQQTAAPDAAYKPSLGQAGKDVVWIPTPQPLVDKMLDMAKVTRKDHLIDLGSGDGRLVITAAKRGVPSLGIEYNPDLVELSQEAARKAGVAGRAKFVKADIFESDFSKATVITLFLLRDLNLRLRPKLLELKPGTRIVSNSFDMDTWKPDQTVTLQRTRCGSAWCTAHLWIVPAQVAGKHRVRQGELTLTQEFQMLSGNLRANGQDIPVEGKVVGDQVRLTAGGKKLVGRMVGGRLVLH